MPKLLFFFFLVMTYSFFVDNFKVVFINFKININLNVEIEIEILIKQVLHWIQLVSKTEIENQKVNFFFQLLEQKSSKVFKKFFFFEKLV